MESLGLDLKILVAQIINFGLLFVILSKVLYKPLIKLLDERSEKIKKSLENSEKLEKELEALKERDELLLKKARSEAEKERKELLEMAAIEKEKILAEAKVLAQAEVQKGIEELKNEEALLKSRIAEEFMDEAVKKLASQLSRSTKRPLLTKILK